MPFDQISLLSELLCDFFIVFVVFFAFFFFSFAVQKMYHENKKFAFETNGSDTRPMSLTVDNVDSQPVDVTF